MAVTTFGPRETLVNNWVSALDGAISDSDTTISVDNATGLPTSGFFRAVIGSEIIRFDGRSGNDLSVLERGAEGTSAASHSDNDEISVRLTAGALQKWFLEQGGTAFSEEATPSSVPIGRHLDEDGTDLTVSDYTWVNQGSATAADSAEGGVVMTLPKYDDGGSGLIVRGKVRTAPSTPYTVTARVHIGPGGGDDYNDGGTGPGIGLAFRESSTGKLLMLAVRYDWAQALWRLTNPSTFSAVVDTNMKYESNVIWLRITDDGSVLKGAFSIDGSNWTQDGTSWWNEGRTAFMSGGPDQYGFFVTSGNAETGSPFIWDSIVAEEQ